MSKVRILCFGDSNTWGYIPGTNYQRYEDRYTKSLQKLLGEEYEVIEEGLNGRTLISDDERPGKEGRNGSVYLSPCLDSHDPLDLVVIMLGTNELKHTFGKSPEEIGNIFEEKFVKVILNKKSQSGEKTPKLIIVAPPNINEDTEYAQERYRGGSMRAKELGIIYKKIANANAVEFVATDDLTLGVDGVHLTKEAHIELAKRLEKVLLG